MFFKIISNGAIDLFNKVSQSVCKTKLCPYPQVCLTSQISKYSNFDFFFRKNKIKIFKLVIKKFLFFLNFTYFLSFLSF